MKLLGIIIFTTMVLKAYGSESTWYESHYSTSKLQKKYELINNKFSPEKFKKVFSLRNKFCEPELIQQLLPLGPANVKYGIIYANKSGLIDEVETDILLGYTNYLKEKSTEKGIDVTKGKEVIGVRYMRMLANKRCLTQKWKDFSKKMSVIQSNGDEGPLAPLNQLVYNEGFIKKDQFLMLEMVRLHQESLSGTLSISEYHEKREQLEKEGYELNPQITEFHNSNRFKSNTPSSRYDLYSNFNHLQLKEMLEFISRFEKRYKYDSSEIVFLENGEIKEKIALNPNEQLRLAIKLYNKEKKDLIDKPYFAGKDFSYRNLLILSYETKQMDDKDLEAFGRLEQKTIRKNFWQKLVGFAPRLNFIVSSLAGPVWGLGYSLTASFVSDIVGPKKVEKPKYEHDIFYGNCEMQL